MASSLFRDIFFALFLDIFIIIQYYFNVAYRKIYGAWLSLVERYVRDVEVACSNHVAPINFMLQNEIRCANLILLFI